MVLEVVLIASAIGALAVAVLNLNNMRDREDDTLKNKKTMAVILGAEKAKRYHTAVLLISVLLFAAGIALSGYYWYLLGLLPLLRLVGHLKRVWQIEIAREFDPELKVIALSSFMTSLLCFIIGLIVYF